AFAIFKKDNPGAEFFIAGKGPLQPELEMLAGGLGILRDVHFVGFLPQPKLLDLYGSSHLFLHPSEISPNQDQEGVPNSVLEAMAMNGAAETVKSKPIVRIAPQFAEELPAK